jgi:hypothetical protein
MEAFSYRCELWPDWQTAKYFSSHVEVSHSACTRCLVILMRVNARERIYAHTMQAFEVGLYTECIMSVFGICMHELGRYARLCRY